MQLSSVLGYNVVHSDSSVSKDNVLDSRLTTFGRELVVVVDSDIQGNAHCLFSLPGDSGQASSTSWTPNK